MTIIPQTGASPPASPSDPLPEQVRAVLRFAADLLEAIPSWQKIGQLDIRQALRAAATAITSTSPRASALREITLAALIRFLRSRGDDWLGRDNWTTMRPRDVVAALLRAAADVPEIAEGSEAR